MNGLIYSHASGAQEKSEDNQGSVWQIEETLTMHGLLEARTWYALHVIVFDAAAMPGSQMLGSASISMEALPSVVRAPQHMRVPLACVCIHAYIHTYAHACMSSTYILRIVKTQNIARGSTA